MTDSAFDPPAFEPVPSARNRHDGWTSQRQHAFIHALAKIGLVSTTAVDRAIDGVEIPYFCGGRQRGAHRVYNDALLVAALRYVTRGRDRDIWTGEDH